MFKTYLCCLVCSQLIDVAFLLDASNSVSSTNWNTLTSYVSSFITYLNIGAPNYITQVAFVKFADVSLSGQGVVFYLNTYSNSQSISNGFVNEQFQTGRETNFVDALGRTRTQVFASNGVRSNSRKIAVVITDGVNDASSDVTTQATLLKQAGVYVIVVGVTSSISDGSLRSQLNSVASNTGELQTVGNFGQLASTTSVTNNLLNYICNSQIPGLNKLL